MLKNKNNQPLICNFLATDRILLWSKLKEFADNKINTEYDGKLKYVQEMEKNFKVNGEHVGYQHFILFPQSFNAFSWGERSRLSKVEIKDLRSLQLILFLPQLSSRTPWYSWL